MLFVYRIISNLLYPLLFIYLEFRKIKKKEDPDKYKQKILSSHFNVTKKSDSKLIWFQAASIGEFKSILPIINQLNIKDKKLKFLITTTTLSSGNLAKIELEKLDNVEHRYFPFDVNFLINKFLREWKPDRIFLVDSEIWPNLILNARDLKIPISIINARLTPKSFNRWMLIQNVAKKIFSILDLCICSSSETKEYLEKLSVKNIYYKGNIKFIDQVIEKKINNINEEFLSNKKFWFAASTHKNEEFICLDAHINLKKKFKNIVTIIAPRHIERTNEIMQLSQKLNLNVQILNKNEIINKDKEIIIINYFGDLLSFYKFSKSVFIGKSMVKKLKNSGGQNPIEAARLNCKIYHGPYVSNFLEIYEILNKNNISKKITNSKELSDNLINDLLSQIKQKEAMSIKIKEIGQKTLNDTMRLVNNFIYNENK
tara:strand:- start:178 stop:1461 length:1284 start_codon:yes stop_codon:yes gene_type:complete